MKFILPMIAALQLAPLPAADVPARRPNILFIIADDASSHFGQAYGCSWVKTPNIDRLARKGLVFDQEALNWFEVSDGSRKNDSGPCVYAKAVARVIGRNQVEVHSPKVAALKYVRFSWHMFARNNLVNSEGLPAFPFRTDDYRNPKER